MIIFAGWRARWTCGQKQRETVRWGGRERGWGSEGGKPEEKGGKGGKQGEKERLRGRQGGAGQQSPSADAQEGGCQKGKRPQKVEVSPMGKEETLWPEQGQKRGVGGCLGQVGCPMDMAYRPGNDWCLHRQEPTGYSCGRHPSTKSRPGSRAEGSHGSKLLPSGSLWGKQRISALLTALGGS